MSDPMSPTTSAIAMYAMARRSLAGPRARQFLAHFAAESVRVCAALTPARLLARAGDPYP